MSQPPPISTPNSRGSKVIFGLLVLLMGLWALHLTLYFGLNSSLTQSVLQGEIEALNANQNGTLSVARVSINADLSTISALHLSLKDAEGHPLVEVPYASLDLLPLLLKSEGPPSLKMKLHQLAVRFDEKGQSDFAAALASRLPEPPAPEDVTLPRAPSLTPRPFGVLLHVESVYLAFPHGEGYLIEDMTLKASAFATADAHLQASLSSGFVGASLNRARTTLAVDRMEIPSLHIGPKGFHLQGTLSRHDGTFATLTLDRTPERFDISGDGLLLSDDASVFAGRAFPELLALYGLKLSFHYHPETGEFDHLSGSLSGGHASSLVSSGFEAHELRLSIPHFRLVPGALAPTITLNLEGISIAKLAWGDLHLFGLDLSHGLLEFRTQAELQLGPGLFEQLYLDSASEPVWLGPGHLSLESTLGLRGGPIYAQFASSVLEADLHLLWRYAPLSKRHTRTLTMDIKTLAPSLRPLLLNGFHVDMPESAPLSGQAEYTLELPEGRPHLKPLDFRLSPHPDVLESP